MVSLIFDLDGTISDPALGIGRSMNHALRAFGYHAIADHELSSHIGPPLDVVFRSILPDTTEDVILALVATYRERYGAVGYAENVVYPGVSEALQDLASRGLRMGVCTSKRSDFAERILELFGLRSHFAFVSGGDVGISKDDQLRVLVERRMIRRDAAMVGDRAADVAAARANGLRSVAVLWGHGSREELARALPDRLLESPTELTTLAGAAERTIRAGGRRDVAGR